MGPRSGIHSLYLPCVFLFDGWVIFLLKNELIWLDKNGKRSETRTEWNRKIWAKMFSSAKMASS